MRSFVETATSRAPRLIPVLRARVTGVRGSETNLESYARRPRPRLARAASTSITYRDHLEPNETLVDGPFWAGQAPLPADATELEVSIEKEHPRARPDQRRRHHALRRPRPHHPRPRDQHPRSRMGGRAERRLHVRLPPGPARARAAHLHRHPAGARGHRPRARRSSAISSRSIPTCRRSTCARCWPRSRASSTT